MFGCFTGPQCKQEAGLSGLRAGCSVGKQLGRQKAAAAAVAATSRLQHGSLMSQVLS